MIKRTIDISDPAFLHLKNQQLLIDKGSETVATIPIEDLGVVLLEHPQIVVTQAVVVACQKNNVALVFCDERHLPYSLLLPVSDGNVLHNKILRNQIEVTKPTIKRLWKQVVIHKVRQQIATLKKAGRVTVQLDRLQGKVKSGDPDNVEAQAARQYWGLLFGGDFRRNVDEPGINALLNYGYAIVRAMIARAIVGGGLHPAIGIFHKNQYNGLCLADDLMEPFRPWVDWLVYSLALGTEKELEVNRETKAVLLGLPSTPVQYDGRKMPLMNACHFLVADFKRCLEGVSLKFFYPEWDSQLDLL